MGRSAPGSLTLVQTEEVSQTWLGCSTFCSIRFCLETVQEGAGTQDAATIKGSRRFSRNTMKI